MRNDMNAADGTGQKVIEIAMHHIWRILFTRQYQRHAMHQTKHMYRHICTYIEQTTDSHSIVYIHIDKACGVIVGGLVHLWERERNMRWALGDQLAWPQRYVASKDGAATTHVGLAVNCADFQMTYQPGVMPYWLHISYHGAIEHMTWSDRLVCAIQHVLGTLLAGKDVVIRCRHG